MSTYIGKSLVPGETVRYSARLSLWKFWAHFFFGGALTIGMLALLIWTLSHKSADSPPALAWIELFVLLLAIGVFFWPIIARMSTELVITDRRLIVKYGLVSTHSVEIRFGKIETVRVSQGLIGRIFGYGDIIVTGTGSTFDPVRSIKNPMRFRAALGEAMESGVSSGDLQAGRNPGQAMG
jgi:uncharacterized membrane protein YdbT with pleckstrin-like domain